MWKNAPIVVPPSPSFVSSVAPPSETLAWLAECVQDASMETMPSGSTATTLESDAPARSYILGTRKGYYYVALTPIISNL